MLFVLRIFTLNARFHYRVVTDGGRKTNKSKWKFWMQHTCGWTCWCMYLCVLHVRQESLTCKRLRDHHKCAAHDIIMLWLRLLRSSTPHWLIIQSHHTWHDSLHFHATLCNLHVLTLCSLLCSLLLFSPVISFNLPVYISDSVATVTETRTNTWHVLHPFHLYTPKLKKSLLLFVLFNCCKSL